MGVVGWVWDGGDWDESGERVRSGSEGVDLFFNDPATTEIDTGWVVGSVRCV